MSSFNIKQGDTLPALRYALEPTSIVLSGATVLFKMRSRSGALIFSRAATIITATVTPTVEYAWQAGDTANAGVYEGEFQVTYASGKIETFPNRGHLPVFVSDEVV